MIANIEVETEECSEAYQNPKCPYVTVINLNSNCVKNIEKSLLALMGVDGTALNDGVIHDMRCEITDLKSNTNVTNSWVSFVKPIAVSVVITAITTFIAAKII